MTGPKVDLVTGASSGLGRETATLLSKRGLRVFGTSQKRLAEQDPTGHEMLQLDVDCDESVKDCVTALLDKTGQLDVPVNNAGFVLIFFTRTRA